MKKFLLFVGASLTVASGLLANDIEVKAQVKVDEDKAVEMSAEEWGATKEKMRSEQSGHLQVAKELGLSAKKIDWRRWIEKEGGWGVATQIDIPLGTAFVPQNKNYSMGAIMQAGIRVGVSKRLFHPNLEFRALTGAGWAFSGNNTGYYIPFNLEVGWAKQYERQPKYIIGLGYETSSIFSKSEIYFGWSPFNDHFMIRLGYGLSGSLKFNVPSGLTGGKVTNQQVSIPADSFFTFGVAYVY